MLIQRRSTIILAPTVLTLLHLWIKAHIVRLRIPALGTDPCDATNIAGFAVFLISGTWAILRRAKSSPSHKPQIDAWRTAEAVILAVFVVVVAEFGVLLRSWPLLPPQQKGIFLLLALEAFAILAAQFLVFWARPVPIQRTRPLAITLSILGPLFLFLVFPQWPTDGDTLLRHLLTVLLGFCALLLPAHSIPLLLTDQRPGLRSTFETLTYFIGLLFVLTGFWELGHLPHTPRIAFLIIFVGCLAMSLAALARPLGIVKSAESTLP